MEECVQRVSGVIGAAHPGDAGKPAHRAAAHPGDAGKPGHRAAATDRDTDPLHPIFDGIGDLGTGR